MGDGGYRAIIGTGNRKHHKWLCDCKGNRTTGSSDLLLRKVNFVFSKVPYNDSSCLLFFILHYLRPVLFQCSNCCCKHTHFINKRGFT
jgi:hypothetical protein